MNKKTDCSVENEDYKYIHNPWASHYSVGEVCSLMNVTRKTLFYYDKIGLLIPAERRGAQKFKLYNEEQLKRLKTIIEYRNAGLSITDIRKLLDDPKADHLQIMENAMKRLLKEKDQKVQEISYLQKMINIEKTHS